MDIIESMREALEESRVVVAQSLTSSLGFQGDPQLLVIDELQFVMGPAAITFDHGDRSRANVTQEDRELLRERQTGSESLTDDKPVSVGGGASGAVPVRLRRYEFPPIPEATGDRQLLRAMQGIYAADHFSVIYRGTQSETTLYYKRKQDRTSNLQVYGTDLEYSVAQYLCSCAKLLSDNRPPNPHGHRLERLYKDFAGSPYLELVLHNLREIILHHLAALGSGFEDVVANPFALQFFLLTASAQQAGPRVMGHTLRYFPLKKERERLDEPAVKTEILDKLAAKSLRLKQGQTPLDFSRSYLWGASKFLIGYAYETGSARYFEDWQDEPITHGTDDEDREIATTIMQTVRGNTPHQFTIPLFANRDKLGAIIISTSNTIAEGARLSSIRCARGAGLPIEMALNMDDEVNKITAKLTQVRTYKHMLSSLLHEERSYCTLLGNLCDSVYKPSKDNPVDQWQDRLRHVIADRTQLVDEFWTDPGTRAVDPIRNIRTAAMFDSDFSTTKEQLDASLDLLKQVFPLAPLVRTSTSFRPQSPALTTVPALKRIVLRRILGNLLRNTAGVANVRRIAGPYLDFSFDLVNKLSRPYVEIVASDNCGGFSEDCPLEEINFDIWSNYLNESEKRGDSVHGTGFLILLKYTSSTKGSFWVENREDDHGAVGARITLRIGLPERRSGA